jgi:hypothetical protein
MAEWWTFRPEDFLLFSPRVYWRLFELHNAAWWPLPVLMPGLGLAMLALALRGHARPVLLSLAAIWAFVGWSFVRGRYATINWAAVYVVPLFGVEALLLVFAAAGPRGHTFDRTGFARRAGAYVAAFAILAAPLLTPLLGRGWASAEVFGLAPDPTAIATLGLLQLARGRLVPWLLPIPALWCLLSTATLWTMGAPGAWIPAAAAVVAVAIALRR